MCSLIIVLVLASGVEAQTRIDGLPCPVGEYRTTHWVPNGEVVAVHTVMVPQEAS